MYYDNYSKNVYLEDVAGSIDTRVSKKHSETFGKEFITNLAMEEAAELIQAISKVKRYPGNADRENNLAEEICDVILMIEELIQLELVDPDEVERWIHVKQKRQIEELDKMNTKPSRHKVTFY